MDRCSCGREAFTLSSVSEACQWLYGCQCRPPLFISEKSCFIYPADGAFDCQQCSSIFCGNSFFTPRHVGGKPFFLHTVDLHPILNPKNIVWPPPCFPSSYQKKGLKYPETAGLCSVPSRIANNSSHSARSLPAEAGCRFWETFCYQQGSSRFPIPTAGANRKSPSTRIHPPRVGNKPNESLTLQNRLVWWCKVDDLEVWLCFLNKCLWGGSWAAYTTGVNQNRSRACLQTYFFLS